MSRLLATKLHAPSIPAKWVHRPHLSRQLMEGLNTGRPVTLVTAPAGFGKTSCVCSWINTLDQWQVSWLSLDPSDDDPGRFFAYLAAALQNAGVNLGDEFVGVIRSGQLPTSDLLSANLINHIWKTAAPFLLILDDFHVIQDPFILETFEKVLANFPQPLHLVLITREDPPLPLARLRAHNQMTEIRATDLRFTRQEVAVFLNDILELGLAPADIAALESKTEGWIVGLQLAGISLRNRTDITGFISQLSGSHRFILSYLIEEVLNQQPEEIQRFLLRTAILDKLNGDLCDAVTERSDSQVMLERISNANLFLIALDEERRWYRYHHLFVDLLRELQKTRLENSTSTLHQRASRWYARASRDEKTFVNEAVQHALMAEDYPAAVEILEQSALDLIMQGYARTVEKWVQQLPGKWVGHSPRTNLALAWMHLLRGSYTRAASHLEQVENVLADERVNAGERRAIEAEWLVMHSLVLNMKGKVQASFQLATKAIEIAPQEDSRVQGLVYFGLASAYQADDVYDQVVSAYQKAIQHTRSTTNSIVEMMSTSGLAQLAFERGELQLAFEITSPICARLEESGVLPPISTVVFGIQGEVYYQWHQIEQAEKYIERALQLSLLGGLASGITNCRVLRARLSVMEGDLDRAGEEIQKAVERIRADTPGYVLKETVAQQVRVCLLRQRPAAAELALQSLGFSFQNRFVFPGLAAGRKIRYADVLLYNSSLRVILHQSRSGPGQVDLEAAVKLADQLVEAALHGQYLPAAIEALLLRSQLSAAAGNQGKSQADLIHAVALGQPEGFIGVFLEQGPSIAAALGQLERLDSVNQSQRDYIQQIRAAFDARSFAASGKAPDAVQLTEVEPLTERELDVLGLMAKGKKYQEIAENLYVSINTVRFHIKTIYRKFDVNNRTQAIEKARQLKIL